MLRITKATEYMNTWQSVTHVFYSIKATLCLQNFCNIKLKNYFEYDTVLIVNLRTQWKWTQFFLMEKKECLSVKSCCRNTAKPADALSTVQLFYAFILCSEKYTLLN